MRLIRFYHLPCLSETMKSGNTSIFYSLLILFSMLATMSACEKNKTDKPELTNKFPLPALLKLINNSNNPVDIRENFLLINFWASWCTPCRKEMSDLQALSETLDKNKFIVIGVSIDADKNLMQEFLLQQNIRFHNFQDPDQQLASQKLAIQTYPETFIVSPNGIIIKRITGEQAWNSPAMHLLMESIYRKNKANTSATSLLKTGLQKN